VTEIYEWNKCIVRFGMLTAFADPNLQMYGQVSFYASQFYAISC